MTKAWIICTVVLLIGRFEIPAIAQTNLVQTRLSLAAPVDAACRHPSDWEPTKYVARLRALKPDDKPFVFIHHEL